jgi:hypothetical protein
MVLVEIDNLVEEIIMASTFMNIMIVTPNIYQNGPRVEQAPNRCLPATGIFGNHQG